MRLLWLGLGWLAMAAGLIGIVLPLVPTTPFLLLAAFCFGRSSERFHHWLVTHKRFGPSIRDWREHGAIGKRSKIAAVLALLGAIAVSLVSGMAAWVVGLQLAVAAGVTTFILTRPSGPRPAE